MAQDQSNSSLPAGEETPKLKDAEELALEALNSDEPQLPANSGQDTSDDNDFADTLHALEKVIESKANKVMNFKNEAKEKRQMIKNVFENDEELQEAEEKKSEVQTKVKERKSSLNESIQVKQLKEDLREIKQEQKELEESLSNHLIHYHQLTNSTSFDTSDGDQWEFNIKAKVKPKRKS